MVTRCRKHKTREISEKIYSDMFHFLSLPLFGAICNALLRVSVKFMKKIYINIFLQKMVGTCWNVLLIAQNQ